MQKLPLAALGNSYIHIYTREGKNIEDRKGKKLFTHPLKLLGNFFVWRKKNNKKWNHKWQSLIVDREKVGA